jgi:hypothetical protein
MMADSENKDNKKEAKKVPLRPIRSALKPVPLRPNPNETQEQHYAKMDYALRVAATYFNVPSTRSLPPSEIKKLQQYGRFLYWYLENFEWLNADSLLESKKKEERKKRTDTIIKPINNDETTK